ncbi:hypothetical protein P4O66_007990, partial [Electrophorus voltai]
MRNAGLHTSESPRLPGNIGAYYTNQELYWQQVYWEWYMQTYYSHLSSLQQWHMACHQNHMQNMAKQKRTIPPPSESEAHADEGQPPSKRPRENLFVEKPLVCDAVVNKEGEVFFSDQILGLLEGIPGILDLAAEMGFSHPHPRWKAFSGDEGSFSHSSSESEAYADEGQPPSKRPRENLFGEEPLVCDAVVTKEGEAFFSDQILGLLEGIPGILDLAAEMGFSWISLSQPWKGNDLHWLKLMRTSFRFSDEESESDDASMAASMDSEGEVAFVHGIDAVLDMPIKIYLELAKPSAIGDLWRKDHLRSHVFPPSVAEE